MLAQGYEVIWTEKHLDDPMNTYPALNNTFVLVPCRVPDILSGTFAGWDKQVFPLRNRKAAGYAGAAGVGARGMWGTAGQPPEA
jgi:hypothetical protein